MSSIGPDLPPHLLAKRKRQAESEEEASSKATTSKAAEEAPKSPDGAEKRRRVMGPAPPPAPLDQLPQTLAQKEESEEESSSDDDYGPSIPTEKPLAAYYDSDSDTNLKDTKPEETTLKRDEWMMLPPTADGLAARMDPTKIRPGKFRSGKSAGGPASAGVDSMWTETLEQKRKRLANEVLGISTPATASTGKVKSVGTSKKDEEAARKIAEYNEKHRGKSLYEEHQKTNPSEKEDDPSKRAFDREKDVGGGATINHTKRKELLNNASNFKSKFSGGNFL
ncbi:hypothetical protein EJ08DRAFT_655607 [Tothia fuscella]|uniref:DUF3752 domain-containing protein n=1 Tax=Tothia fuscella TaxID=1048955 RepID=A0A9P4P3J6_9PEZI|nr:hypothetical protein EJ08DRAFT_655607 [Tothia fuscella]